MDIPSRETCGLGWKESILSQIRRRNINQCYCFQELILLHNKTFESWNKLKNENIQLSIQFEKLRLESSSGLGPSNTAIALLEKKLLEQQEELTELHKKRGENAQLLVNLNEKLQAKEEMIAKLDDRISELVLNEATMRIRLDRFKEEEVLREERFQMLKDEHQALQLTTTHLEEKLRKVQYENQELVERLMKYKYKDAEKLNEENETFLKKKNARVQKELADAATDMKCGVLPDLGPYTGPSFEGISSRIPSRAAVVFDAHDGEVNTVKWGRGEKMLITGGTDRKVKLWEPSEYKNVYLLGTLVGSNAGVMSVETDPSGVCIVGTSADYAVRVWTVADHRIRQTMTGHSNKVMAAQFIGDQSKLVSGSHDRTIKFWDLNMRVCLETKFAMSLCNDLTVLDTSGTTVISGHFDKTLKFWDSRKGRQRLDPFQQVQLPGRVTSVEISKDGKSLLACLRDDTLRILDIRTNNVVSTFSADDFKVGCDWTRASFSSDSDYVAAGSADGTVYIWNVAEGKVEATLKEHKSSVIAVVWHHTMNIIASVEKNKKAIVWD